MHLENEMKYIRARRGISQSSLADIVDVSRQTIHAIENSKINPSLLVAMKIANALDADINEVFQLSQNDKSSKSYVIGIGGVSQSGKSSLAKKIKKGIVDRIVKVISLDDHTVPVDKMPHVHGLPDWERPESYDFEKIKALLDRSNGVADIIIIEGIHAFQDPELVDAMNLKIQMEIPYKTFLKRRTKDKRWGEEPEWYYDHVWNMHLNYDPKIKDLKTLSGKGEEKLDKLISSIRVKV